MRHDLQINFGERLLTVEQLTDIATAYSASIDTSKHPNHTVLSGLDDWTAVETAVNNLLPQSIPREHDAFTSGFDWCIQYNAVY